MKYTPLSYEVNLREGVIIELSTLCAALCTLHDKRVARGLRYALVTVLVFILLAKLAGQDHLRGIAQWVKLRQERLADALGLAAVRAGRMHLLQQSACGGAERACVHRRQDVTRDDRGGADPGGALAGRLPGEGCQAAAPGPSMTLLQP
jgi:hypothetical protein